MLVVFLSSQVRSGGICRLSAEEACERRHTLDHRNRGPLRRGDAIACRRWRNQGPDPQRHGPTLPAFLVHDAAMREALAKSTTQRFQFFSEALDAHRFAFADFEQDFFTLLRNKYKGVTFDVVVPVSEPALNFVRRHRSELWPDAWVFFYGVPQQAIQGIESEARMAGILTRRTVDKTVELARKLQPSARRLLVISGEPQPEKEAVEMARGAFADMPEVEFAFGLPLPELVQRVAQEPADAIVVYYAQSRDREGRPYVPRDLLRTLAAASAAPVYGTHETYFGTGIAAGVTESYTNRGRIAAKRLIQLAAGETIPVLSTVPDFCAADARALRKWSLDEGRLPEACEVLFAERSRVARLPRADPWCNLHSAVSNRADRRPAA